MGRTVGIGIQDFRKIRENNYLYIDKTSFIREWWESGDDVTLITRPRRFGKTLNMSMTEQFFSLDYAGRDDLFEGLAIWEDEEYRKLQGTYPVISLSFASVKDKDYKICRKKICEILTKLYAKYAFLMDSNILHETEKAYFRRVCVEMDDSDATLALYQLSDFLCRYYGRKVIILLDEYDTPMQEAYVNGFWDELVGFTRSLFNATFKTNPYLERGIMTGITRVSRESIFSDLNNLKVVTTTSDKYATSFGFTEEEAFATLDECGLSDRKGCVKKWYDGFIFGKHRDIYNPWSILNFLDTGKLACYWANTSSNSLVGKLIREGNNSIKEQFETLLAGGAVLSAIDEQIVYNRLNGNERAVWSFLLASGYLKVLSYEKYDEIPEGARPRYELVLTNHEVKLMFEDMICDWFSEVEVEYNGFIKSMLEDDLDAMNEYMMRIIRDIFSFFDIGDRQEPERFYHGFVLGLMVDLRDRYNITSNRESGFGRYDVMLEPKDPQMDDGIILEFKVLNPRREKTWRKRWSLQRHRSKKSSTLHNLKQRGARQKKSDHMALHLRGRTC